MAWSYSSLVCIVFRWPCTTLAVSILVFLIAAKSAFRSSKLLKSWPFVAPKVAPSRSLRGAPLYFSSRWRAHFCGIVEALASWSSLAPTTTSGKEYIQVQEGARLPSHSGKLQGNNEKRKEKYITFVLKELENRWEISFALHASSDIIREISRILVWVG